jgi:integrase/recombinase XerD
MILFLLDTGIRASELCNLKIADVDVKEGSAVVQGKGRLDSGHSKERIALFGAGTRTAVYRYLLSRGNRSAKAELFVTSQGRRINRGHLTTHLRRLGWRADVQKCHPHRFRHTFFISEKRGRHIHTSEVAWA